MKNQFVVVATALTLATVACITGTGFPGNIELAASTDRRWMDEVARNAMSSQSNVKVGPALSGADGHIQTRVHELSDNLIPTVEGPRVSDKFSNIQLLDQHGRHLRFYDDLIKDRSVCIVFFYTRCTGSCPGTTVSLKKIRKAIASEFPGDNFKFISLTLEPEVDTPGELQEYMDRYHISDDPDLPEWIYATGDFDEVDGLRRELGVYDLDPIIDADKTEHAAIVTFGNDRTDRWAALPVGMGERKVAETIIRITGNTDRQRYASTLVASHPQLFNNEQQHGCCTKKKASERSCCLGDQKDQLDSQK